ARARFARDAREGARAEPQQGRLALAEMEEGHVVLEDDAALDALARLDPPVLVHHLEVPPLDVGHLAWPHAAREPAARVGAEAVVLDLEAPREVEVLGFLL